VSPVSEEYVRQDGFRLAQLKERKGKGVAMPRSRKLDGLYRRENGIFAFRFKSPNGEWREVYREH